MKRQLKALDRVRRIAPALWSACWLAMPAVAVSASPSGDGEDLKREAIESASAGDANGPSQRIAPPLKVTVDRETGEIVAVRSSEHATVLTPAIAEALSRSTAGLRVFDLANGGKGVDLEGRFQHVVVVRVQADGSLVTSCVDHVGGTDELIGDGPAEADRGPEDK